MKHKSGSMAHSEKRAVCRILFFPKRVGHLFQGRFKAILVEADEYAVELSRYIHLCEQMNG
jgi:hypothetical protein